jgi:3-oxoacyl-[acyl-carrier protein] reductase
MKLAGRHAIVTGAGQGLGAAITERFLAEGASVLVCARTLADLQALHARLGGGLRDGQRLLIHEADVADPAAVDGLVSAALAAFPKIDILVNNAGVYGPLGALEDVDWRAWVDAVNINLMGTVYITRCLLPHFKSRRYGKIICISGGGATNPLPRISAYAASKAAAVRFAETLALEVKEFGIDVNSVAPGALATRLMDQVVAAGPEAVSKAFHERMVKLRGEGATPLEIGADLCVYLGGAESDGITGKLIAAVWDPWSSLQQHRADLDGTDIYTLRRIVPADRGRGWGEK